MKDVVMTARIRSLLQLVTTQECSYVDNEAISRMEFIEK